jgi:hypothetical protein
MFFVKTVALGTGPRARVFPIRTGKKIMPATPNQPPVDPAVSKTPTPAPMRGADYLEGSDTRAGSDEGGSASGDNEPTAAALTPREAGLGSGAAPEGQGAEDQDAP